jgi:glyoxylate reductase
MISEKIDKEIIDELRKCKIIANCAVGFNNIDVEYARHKILLLQTHRTS